MATISRSGLSLAPVEPSDEAAVRQWYELRSSVVHADLSGDPPLGAPRARDDAKQRETLTSDERGNSSSELVS